MLGNIHVHVAKLRAVALIEDDYAMLIIDFVLRILLNKNAKLLDSSDNNLIITSSISLRIFIFELALQDMSIIIAISRAFFKAVVFLHRLII